jgi:hypothetical protein
LRAKPLTIWVAAGGAFGALTPGVAEAHAFGQRYDLPIPLWLYLTGAGLTVALSFVVIAFFMGRAKPSGGYPHCDLLRSPIGGFLGSRAVLSLFRLISVALFLLIIVAGFIGEQSPFKNIGPPFVWVIWWVGFAYVSALLGNLWALINPWKILFAWGAALHARLRPGRRFGLGLRYPPGLGVWPGIVLFLAFAWAELVWTGAERPEMLAGMILLYSAITWTGMFLFGREEWLRRGEAFSLVFGLFARFGPTEVRATTELCPSCTSHECRSGRAACVDCYECFAKDDKRSRRWNLRPYAVGLLPERAVPPSLMILVLVMLATVTFDGFRETSAWAAILDWVIAKSPLRPFFVSLHVKGIDIVAVVTTVALLVFPVLFFLVYRTFALFMSIALRSARPAKGGAQASGTLPSSGELARLLVLSLIPIGIAYHLAHYLSYLMLAGQFIIPLVSNPFGFGWNIFGTALYRLDVTVVNARLVWYTAVAAIVLGHMLAIYVAHATALRALGDRALALRSQYPMLGLMVGYTMVSLWILAQPVVETGG